MESFAKILLHNRPRMLVLGIWLAGCTLESGSGDLGFDDASPGAIPSGDGDDDGVTDDGEAGTDEGDAGTDDTSGAIDDTAGDGDSSGDAGGTSGGGDTTSGGSDTGDGASGDTGVGDTTSGDTGTSGGAAGQPSSGMYSHCLSVTDCDPGFGCLTNDTATDGFCSVLCSPVGDPVGCDPDPAGVLDPTCTVAGGGESVCALDCSGGEPCPDGMICTADSLICM